jgi:hypothetical protein
MMQSRHSFSLPQKTVTLVVRSVTASANHFQRHQPVQAHMPGFKNLTHCAASE